MNDINLVKIDIPIFLENTIDYLNEILIFDYYQNLLKLFLATKTKKSQKPVLDSGILENKIKMLKRQFETEPLSLFFRIEINYYIIGILLFSKNQELKVILQPSLIKKAIKNNIQISNNLFKDILIKFIELEHPSYFYSAVLPFLSEYKLSNKVLDEWVIDSDYKEYHQVMNDKNIVNNYSDNYRFFLLKS